MKIKTYYRLILIVLINMLFLTGCMTAGKHALPKGGDMTMAEIYKQETGLSMNAGQDNPYDLAGARSMAASLQQPRFTATDAAQLKNVKNLFKPLPNPEIALYVYPHLVHNNDGFQPVPGYTTAFFLYQKNHFAMPSEVY